MAACAEGGFVQCAGFQYHFEFGIARVAQGGDGGGDGFGFGGFTLLKRAVGKDKIDFFGAEGQCGGGVGNGGAAAAVGEIDDGDGDDAAVARQVEFDGGQEFFKGADGGGMAETLDGRAAQSANRNIGFCIAQCGQI